VHHALLAAADRCLGVALPCVAVISPSEGLVVPSVSRLARTFQPFTL